MPVSQKQAKWMGIIAGGGTPRTGKHGMSQKEARDHLRGYKVKELPVRTRKGRSVREAYR